MNPKHCKTTTYEKMPDGSVKITSKSYYEELAHVLEEFEKPYLLTEDVAKRAMDKALERITSKSSPKVIITITPSADGKIKVVEKYTTLKQSFK